jgi:uncharacterized repeat protein (TIGR03803 family)
MPNRFSVMRALALVGALCLPLNFAQPAFGASKYRVIYNFPGGSHGSGPNLFDALAIDGKGNLYGAAAGGTGTGCDGPCGVIYEMSPSASGKWTESVPFNFNGYYVDGEPYTALAIDSRGSLWGAVDGGPPGTNLFQLTKGAQRWSFGLIQGQATDVGVTPDAAGNLYGYLVVGAYGDGGVGELSYGTDGWSLATLYSFCRNGNCSTGVRPLVPLSWDAKGNLYGTTYEGGFNYPQCYCGVAFQLTPSSDGTWTYHRLHVFGSFPDDGRFPYGGLTVDAAGNVYGTATHGGPNEDGAVFKLTPTSDGRWKETMIYGFGNECNCTSPANNLVFDKAGNLYGTAATFEECKVGGNGCGLVFKLTPQKNGTWKYSLVHLFRGPDGEYPNGLTMDGKGNLYGTTTLGGKYDVGVVFEITP